jgi:hypothetical protein
MQVEVQSHPAAPTLGSRGNAHPTTKHKALIVEDLREACIILRRNGYECDRITHNELMTSTGEELTGQLIKGAYNLMWTSTPTDWYVRTPDKRSNPHWQRLINWITRAARLEMQVVIFGPPGFVWKLPNFKDTMEDLQFHMTKMRLCHFGEKYKTDTHYQVDRTSKWRPTSTFRDECGHATAKKKSSSILLTGMGKRKSKPNGGSEPRNVWLNHFSNFCSSVKVPTLTS